MPSVRSKIIGDERTAAFFRSDLTQSQHTAKGRLPRKQTPRREIGHEDDSMGSYFWRLSLSAVRCDQFDLYSERSQQAIVTQFGKPVGDP